MAEAVGIFVALVVAIMIYRAMRDGLDDGTSASTRHRHCMTCGAEGAPGTKRPLGGAALLVVWVIGLALAVMVHWMWLIAAAFFHLIADLTSKRVCASCGADALVPKKSPAAVAHRRQLQPPVS